MSSGDTVALVCATFLKPEMLHIHRHVTGLRSFRPLVLAGKLEGHWPIERLVHLPRSPWRGVAREISKWTGTPWQITASETKAFLRAAEGSRLFHIFFGNVAIHHLPLLRSSTVPVVVSFHGSDVTGAIARPGYAAARRELFSRARLILCRSEQLGRAVVALGCPPEKIRLMRTVLPDLPVIEREAPPDGAWRILQAARLVPKKGLFTAVDAFRRFAKEHPNAVFTIAGEGPLEDELRERAAGLAVRFTGFLSQDSLLDEMRNAHIFIHPSETVKGDVEGVPNAMLEAMATGLPVVATRHGGIVEVIRDRENGLLCPECDPTAVAAALTELSASDELRRSIARRAAESVRAEFSAERQIAKIEDLYREACA